MTDQPSSANAADIEGRADAARTRIVETGHNVHDKARDGAAQAISSTSEMIRDHPFAATAIALSAGAMIGLMLPGARIGHGIAAAARRTAKLAATVEMARTIAGLVTTASSSVRHGAHDLADRMPGFDDMRKGTANSLAKVSETVQNAGHQAAEVARKAGGRIGLD